MQITRTQLAKELKCTTKWIDECRKSGRLPEYEPGSKLFDRAKALAAWQEWQDEIAQNDEAAEASDELLASLLRRWKARVELLLQSKLDLERKLIFATAARDTYDGIHAIVAAEFDRFALGASEAITECKTKSEISKALQREMLISIELIREAHSSGDGESGRAVDLKDNATQSDNPALEFRDRIDVQKTIYNNLDADIKETKAQVVKGELLMFDDVAELCWERINGLRTEFTALPGNLPGLLLGHGQSTQLQRIKDKLANLMERHFVPFEVKDFQSAEIISQYRIEAQDKKEIGK
jgi:hypothetical protein